MEEPRELRGRSKQFALRIIRGYGGLPKTNEAQVIGRRVLRSGTSVGAHYREASRARSDAEYINKIGAALQALDETAYWLELVVEGEIIPAHKLVAIQHETEELIAIFTTIVKKVRRKDEGRRMKEEGPEWMVSETELSEASEEEGLVPRQKESEASPEAWSPELGALLEPDQPNPPATGKKKPSIPPPPPTWAHDDDALLSHYSSFNMHPSYLLTRPK